MPYHIVSWLARCTQTTARQLQHSRLLASNAVHVCFWPGKVNGMLFTLGLASLGCGYKTERHLAAHQNNADQSLLHMAAGQERLRCQSRGAARMCSGRRRFCSLEGKTTDLAAKWAARGSGCTRHSCGTRYTSVLLAPALPAVPAAFNMIVLDSGCVLPHDRRFVGLSSLQPRTVEML